MVLHCADTDTEAAGNEMQDIVKMVKEKTGIDIQFTIIPKDDTVCTGKGNIFTPHLDANKIKWYNIEAYLWKRQPTAITSTCTVSPSTFSCPDTGGSFWQEFLRYVGAPI